MGDGRSPFKFMTYSGGLPAQHLYLVDETIQVWAGSGATCGFSPPGSDEHRDCSAAQAWLLPRRSHQMVHPPVINYQPATFLLRG